MTNYNKRLDEVLQGFAMAEQQIGDELAVGAIQEETFDTRDTLARDQAKQALTSLIKELVAEAKPGKYSSGEYILNVDGIGEVDGYEGYNQAIDQFEQNLLKALEEV